MQISMMVACFYKLFSNKELIRIKRKWRVVKKLLILQLLMQIIAGNLPHGIPRCK